ncbi:ankyrin repeat protein [Archangium gephyra]|uniref:Ankyrin repeat protein n=2 Tax=Archangium gephyra TaxID=48 RepID=A0ABX9JTS2_9BACT|nr:ankyrin repeat domain-containing protein [Archangium gephyra]REG27028.1 ankyrin repeat protein [Archangium gephyra]
MSKELFTAIEQPDTSRVKALLAAGADPNVCSRDGITPLRTSAEVGNLDMASLLLGAGATRTINDWGGLTGYTALGHAARRLDLPMIKLLLDVGADPKAPDEDGRPAHYRLPPRAESDSQTWDAAFELLGGAKDRMPL